ncbi:hypothetical protein CYMTET_4224 [Cymbomonas tetramitiformis]|uniref:Uncharacterized protein n=1 Tax=Cymbomonas tetramitiformis TaxID=36881 RepID=A0AAE0LKM9_9CHLO|nr:hypothetical protein CYMTET_4224 [Cymbomonas tetramitiformis]
MYTRDHPCPSDDTKAYCIDGTRLNDDLRRLIFNAKPCPVDKNLLWCACVRTKLNALAKYLYNLLGADWKTHCQVDVGTRTVHVTPKLAELVARFMNADDVGDAIIKWVKNGCVPRNPKLTVELAKATGNLKKAAEVDDAIDSDEDASDSDDEDAIGFDDDEAVDSEEDAIDSDDDEAVDDDDELMHNVQTVPTVTMDDANAAKNVIATPNAARAIETTLPPGQFECNGKWISSAKHAEVALVYMRYSKADVALAKNVLNRLDEKNGTRTQFLVREGQADADDELMLHQADAEFTRKRARDEDAERQRTLAKARKLDDYELQEKEYHLRRLQLELQQQEKEMQIRIAKLHQELETQKKTDAEELEIRKSRNAQELETQKSRNAQELETQKSRNAQELEIQKSRNAHDLRVHQFRDIKSAFESCLTIPKLSTEEANVYRAHIHNMVANLVTNADASAAAPAIAAPPPVPPVNVTVNNITENNNTKTDEKKAADADGGGEVTLEEQLWREAWLKRGTPENPEVTIADFLADPSEPEHARYAEFMRSNPGFVETFRRRLAEAWRKRHGTWNIPTQAGTA